MKSTNRHLYRAYFIKSFYVICRSLRVVCRWTDLENEYYSQKMRTFENFYEVLEQFYTCLGNFIFNSRDNFVHTRAEMYARDFENIGTQIDDCVCITYKTNLFIAIQRGRGKLPTNISHKGRNSIKIQTVTTPDGLLLHIPCTAERRSHNFKPFGR